LQEYDNKFVDRRFVFKFEKYGKCELTGGEMLSLGSLKRSLNNSNDSPYTENSTETTNSKSPIGDIEIEIMKNEAKVVFFG